MAIGSPSELVGLAGYVEAESVHPVAGSDFPLEEVAAARRVLERSGGFGKRVVQTA